MLLFDLPLQRKARGAATLIACLASASLHVCVCQGAPEMHYIRASHGQSSMTRAASEQGTTKFITKKKTNRNVFSFDVF